MVGFLLQFGLILQVLGGSGPVGSPARLDPQEVLPPVENPVSQVKSAQPRDFLQRQGLLYHKVLHDRVREHVKGVVRVFTKRLLDGQKFHPYKERPGFLVSDTFPLHDSL